MVRKSLISYSLALVAALLVLSAPWTRAATIFQDGFELGSLGSAWSISGTNNWRTTVTGDFSPANGSKHLVLDDSGDDAISSVAEATVTLNLSYKKNVVLTFAAKSLGNEPHNPPTGNFSTSRAYDGVAISVNGGNSWRAVQSLANVGLAYTTYSVSLDPIVSALGGTYGPETRIRFSEYDNSPAPIDGIAIDDVILTADDDPQSIVELPSPLIEGTGPQTGYVSLSFAPAYDLTLTLVTSPAGQLAIPASVVVPAGQKSVSFQFSVTDDNLTNLTRDVTVSATAPGLTARSGKVTVYDDEAPTLTVNVPAQVREGVDIFYAFNASITLSHPADTSFSVNITTDPPGQIQTYSSAYFYTGQTRYNFSFNAWDDSAFEGNMVVTVTASAPGVPTATTQSIIIDNEVRALSLTLPPGVQEDGVSTGTVSIPGYLDFDLAVQLRSSDPAAATLPATVIIPAGSFSNDFIIAGHDNGIMDGSRSVTITGEASSFTPASAVTSVRDNEAAGYLVKIATDIVDAAAPVSYVVSAADKEGNKIIGSDGMVNVELVRSDGTSQAANPATLTLTGTDTTGTVNLPTGVKAPLRLRVSDGSGRSGRSNSFNLMRVLPIAATDLVWDSFRQRIYASVPQNASTYANQVVAIDPITAQVVGSISVGDDPGHLALTSEGEALYVALNATGVIARIAPQTMSVVSTFALGHNSSGPFFEADMSAVKGQPNVVVVLRHNANTSYPSDLVAYDNGVMRPNTLSATLVEPSADTGIIFAYPQSYGGGLSRVQVSASGLAVLASPARQFSISGPTVSDGYFLTDSSSNLIDGVSLKLLGNFFQEYSFSDRVARPESAKQRVYFVDSSNDDLYRYDVIRAYDSTSFSLIRQLTMPLLDTFSSGFGDGNALGSFIRWGATGLAFRANTITAIVDAPDLVPAELPTDLSVSMTATPPAIASADAPVTYNVQVKNSGNIIAHDVVLKATLSDAQLLQSFAATSGQIYLEPSEITVDLDDVAPNGTASLTITTSPQSAGFVSCTASVSSSSVDPDFHNNTAFNLVPVAFDSRQDALNQLPLGVNNVIYDQGRDLLWVSCPITTAPPLGRSIVSIDPHTGKVSDPVPLDANPRDSCIALSSNGRYLYIGFVDTPALARIDLTSSPYQVARVALNMTNGGSISPLDLEVLDGDGTSFIVSSYGTAAVFDGSVARPTVLSDVFTNRIERTTTPNVFANITSSGTPVSFRRLQVTASGVTIQKAVQDVLQGDIVASGNFVLSSYGQLGNTGTLTRAIDFGLRGTPCLDTPNGRAYLVYNHQMNAFDITAGQLIDVLPLPTSDYYQWAQSCVRWGADGFAIAGPDRIFLARWSAAVPPNVDQNNDGVADAWEAKYFGTLKVNLTADTDNDGTPTALEYFFATSPVQGNANPLQIGLEDVTGGEVLHLVYNRRLGIAPVSYRYETSSDLAQWTSASTVTETILGSQVVDGASVQTIDAAISAPNAIRTFVRVRWLAP